ncbi:autotransporter domain-containing protein [Agrobacterium sp. BA1120]|uniref:autotransporter family protein n=1 Tax=Agrobacterium sp. BA1120 TaxID=3228927 RepID=UPI00336AEA06
MRGNSVMTASVVRRSKGVGAISRGALLASTVLLTMPQIAWADPYLVIETTKNLEEPFNVNAMSPTVITKGGRVNAPTAIIAGKIGEHGELNVENGGVLSSKGDLIVGDYGTGTLNIGPESLVNSMESVIGASVTPPPPNTGDEDEGGDLEGEGGSPSNSESGFPTPGNGKVHVAGKGAVWNNSGTLTVGRAGDGELAISNGAVVSVGKNIDGAYDGTVKIADEVGSTGRLIIGTDPNMIGSVGAEAGVLNAEQIAFGQGHGDIVFNHTSKDYDFSADLSGKGTILQKAGETILSGHSSDFTGTMSVQGGTLNVRGELGGKTTIEGGDLTLSNGGRVTGDVTVSSGVLNIGAAEGEKAAEAGFIGGNVTISGGNLVFNHTDIDYNFYTDINNSSPSNNVGMIKQIAGVTTLSGHENSFNGVTEVYGGTLNLASLSTLGGDATVYDGGTIGGSGTFSNNLTIRSGGTLLREFSSIEEEKKSPSIDGPLKVGKNLTFQAGSTYKVDLTNAAVDSTDSTVSTSSFLDAETVTILAPLMNSEEHSEGAKVQIKAINNSLSYKEGQTYTILKAENVINGKFSSIDNSYAFLEASFVDSLSDTVQLKLALKTNDGFVSHAQTSSQRSLGSALNSLDQTANSTSLKLYNDVLLLEENQVQKTYEQLSGEVHATAQGAFTQTNRAVNTALNSRVRSVTDGVAAPSSLALGYAEEEESPVKDDRFAAYENKKSFDTDRFATWVNGFGSWGKVSGVDGSSDTDVSNGGVLVGGDVGFGENTRVGVLGGYSRSFFSTDSSSGNSTNYHVGTYAGTKIGAVSLRTGANYTWHDVDTMRSITALGQSLYGDYDGSSFNIYGELAYRIEAGKSAFEPFAALAYSRTKTDGFTETGGPAALTVESSAMNTTYTTMGLRASSDFEVGGVASVARGTFGWQHAFGDIDPVSTARFATGDSFSTSSTPIDRNTALLEAGLDFTVTPSSTVSVSYNGQIGSNAYDHGMNAKFRLKF